LIVPGIVAFANKIAPENREKMKLQAVVGINGSWSRQRNGRVDILDMTEVGSGRVVGFEIVETEIASGRGNHEGPEMEWKSNR
jgi:hypothetical protein